MNRTQAKQRFTVLTGLPATKHASMVCYSMYSTAYIFDYFSSVARHPNGHSRYDRRTTQYWVTLVQAIESYIEVA